MIAKEKANKITATLKLVVTEEFYDDEASEETLRSYVEQCLEEDGFSVEVGLFKVQEPRVLTLAEVRDEYEVVWLETKYLQPTAAILDHGESNAKWLCVVFGADNSYTSSWRSYGKKWRCWSSKPTEEQMEAVPWNT